MANTQSRYVGHSLLTYAEVDQCKEILKKHEEEGQIIAWALNYHDKDKWSKNDKEVKEGKHEEGQPKIPHTHIVLYLKDAKSRTTVINWFKGTTDFKGELANTFDDVTYNHKGANGVSYWDTIDLCDATYYLAHEYGHDTKNHSKGDPIEDKYHYGWHQVIGFNIEVLKSYERPKRKDNQQSLKEDNTYEILEKYMNHENLRDMAKQYGRDFIMNFRKYQEFEKALRWQEDSISEIYSNSYAQAWLDARGDAVSDMVVASRVIEDQTKQIEAQTREIEILKASIKALGIVLD